MPTSEQPGPVRSLVDQAITTHGRALSRFYRQGDIDLFNGNPELDAIRAEADALDARLYTAENNEETLMHTMVALDAAPRWPAPTPQAVEALAAALWRRNGDDRPWDIAGEWTREKYLEDAAAVLTRLQEQGDV